MTQHDIDRLARAGAAVAEALSGRDAAAIETTIKAMDAALAAARATDGWNADGGRAATLRALANSLDAATARVEKLTGATWRRRALIDAMTGRSLPPPPSTRLW